MHLIWKNEAHATAEASLITVLQLYVRKLNIFFVLPESKTDHFFIPILFECCLIGVYFSFTLK